MSPFDDRKADSDNSTDVDSRTDLDAMAAQLQIQRQQAIDQFRANSFRGIPRGIINGPPIGPDQTAALLARQDNGAGQSTGLADNDTWLLPPFEGYWSNDLEPLSNPGGGTTLVASADSSAGSGGVGVDWSTAPNKTAADGTRLDGPLVEPDQSAAEWDRLTRQEGHPISAFSGNEILAGRSNPVSYATASIDDKSKTIQIHVKMNYGKPGLMSRMGGFASGVSDQEFAKYVGLANAGLAKYWSRDVNIDGSDYAVTVSAEPSANGLPITLANPGSSWLGDLSQRSRNPYPVLNGNVYYDSRMGDYADGVFSRNAAHEIGHAFLTDAFGIPWSWGHEKTSSILGKIHDNAPLYPETGEISLMPYYNDSPKVRVDEYVQNSMASQNDVKTLIYIADRR